MSQIKIYGGIHDSDVQARQKRLTPVEKRMVQMKQWVADQMSHCAYLEDNRWDPTNILKMTGRAMTSTELELRLKRILPSNCIFIDNNWRKTKRAVVRIKGNSFETLCPYDRGLMPEHSILRVRTEDIPDPDYLGTPYGKSQRMERADFKDFEWDSNRGEYVFDPTRVRPGFKRIKRCYGEDPEGGRGWRTVLIRLVENHVVTITAVEKEFGADDSPRWSQNVGKSTGLLLPW